MEKLLYWVWLSRRCYPDTPIFGKLYSKFGSAENIYRLTDSEIDAIEGITQKQALLLKNKDASEASEIIKTCRQKNIGIVTYSDELFPSRLRDIKNPPVLLYYKGTLPDFNLGLCIGTVGTRHPTFYGSRCAYEIAFDLAVCGAYVISGMAKGIDAICHQAALDAGGKTVAVLGCGVDVIYPKENTELYEKLCIKGTVMSEYPPGAKASTYTFPQRNRIISGLSLGSLVVEAQIKSGAMITAKNTLEQHRDLFAVPGNAGEANSMGPNQLIKNGAHAVTNAKDILKEYSHLYADTIDLGRLPKYGSESRPHKFATAQRPPVRPTVREESLRDYVPYSYDGNHAGSAPVGSAYGNHSGSAPVVPAYGNHSGSAPVGSAYGNHAGSAPVGSAYGNHAGSAPVGPAYGNHIGSAPVGSAHGNHAGSAPVSPSYGNHAGSAPVGYTVVGGYAYPSYYSGKKAQEQPPQKTHIELSEPMKTVYSKLSSTTPMTPEDIASVTNVSLSDIMSSLTILEIQGIVKAMPGGTYLLV